MNRFGVLLKAGREALSLTIRDVEASTGISNAYLSQMENGYVKRPALEKLKLLGDLYHIPYEVLMTHTGFPLPDYGLLPNADQERHAILIIDDSANDRELYRTYLENARDVNFEIHQAASGEEGLRLMVSIRPDCALLDYRLPDIDGIEVLERLKKNKQVCDIPVAIITGQGSEEVAVQAIKLGAINYLVKGDITDERLVSVALQGVQRGKLKAGIRERMRAKGGQVIDADEYISGAITTIDALVERVQVKSNALKDDPDLAAARSGLAELLRYVRNEKHVQDFS